jgi:Flp pilus assembly protein TadG
MLRGPLTTGRRFRKFLGRRLPLHRENGQALIEFALVLVPLLIIIFGAIEFGIAWNRKNDAVHLANEAVRMAIAKNFNCASLQSEANSNGIQGAGQVDFSGGLTLGSTMTATVSGIPLVDVVPLLVPGVPSTVGASAQMRIEQNLTALPGTCAF